MKKVVLDFETQSTCNIKKCGAWVYSEDPTTHVLMLYYKIDGIVYSWFPGDPPPKKLFDAMEDLERYTVAFNIGFEQAIWINIMIPMYGWSDVVYRANWEDTQAMCAYKSLPLALDRVGGLLNLDMQKDAEGKKSLNIIMKPHPKSGSMTYYPKKYPSGSGVFNDYDNLLRNTSKYCEMDVNSEEELSNTLGILPPGERKVWQLDQKINRRGVRIDMPYAVACQRIVDKELIPLRAGFKEITGYNPTQRAKVKGWFNENGLSIPDTQKETIELVSERTDLPEDVSYILSIFRKLNSTSIAKLKSMRDCTGSDGRVRGLLQYHGATTGRWSGRLLQPQNFPRGTIDKKKFKEEYGLDLTPDILVEALMTEDPEHVREMFGCPIEAVSSGLRHALIPTEGRLFCAGDFKTIEARVVLALAGQWDKVGIIRKGEDIYCNLASMIYGRTITKEDENERNDGKGGVLGLGFQMGPSKFQSKYAPDKPLSFAKGVVGIYREDFAPEVPKLWRAFEQASMQAVWTGAPQEAYGIRFAMEGQWLTVRLPSGRKLNYFNAHKVNKPMPWDEDDIRPGWAYQAVKTGRVQVIHAYGGHITENIVQAIARDLMADRMFVAEANNFPLVLTIHDELISEPLIKYADPDAFEQILEDAPRWAIELGIPLEADCWAGDRYKK